MALGVLGGVEDQAHHGAGEAAAADLARVEQRVWISGRSALNEAMLAAPFTGI